MIAGDGTLKWILDAYTTSDGYPYAQRLLDGTSYMRNSVKLVIDASSPASLSRWTACRPTYAPTCGTPMTSTGFRPTSIPPTTWTRRRTSTTGRTSGRSLRSPRPMRPCRSCGTSSCACRRSRRPSSSTSCRSRHGARRIWPPGWWRETTATSTGSCWCTGSPGRVSCSVPDRSRTGSTRTPRSRGRSPC
ncbi:MAG: UPF0182 family protein, partial [Gemmatimonadales bacterium]|nr:UPF0182 family protein [Gemmatimonadales bacterium]